MALSDMQQLIAVARGDAPADLVLANARIVNTFTGEIEEGSVAVYGGRIAGVGDYKEGRQVVDLGGRYLAPGLIDGHYHLESSMLHVDQYARAVVPHGTLAAVTDLHEVTNVCGLPGMRYILECGRRVPMDMFFVAPSCVPATSLETSGARLGPADIRKTLRWKGVLGLGEMMNFPGVINGDADTLAKIAAAGERVKDGHAPRVMGRALNAYMAPLIGSDHETTERHEGLEKLRRGMRLMIREGSAEKNLEDLLPLVTNGNYHRCMLVVDDRNARDIYHDGDVDAVVRKAIRLGLDPVRAVQMASLNVAEYFRLPGLGGIGPGYFADLLVLDDLKAFHIQQVYFRGRLAAEDGRPLFQPRLRPNPEMTRTMHIRPFDLPALALRSDGGDSFPVIEIVPGQIVTRWVQERPARSNGAVVADPERDLLKIVVVERHKATGNIGLGLVKGFGLKRGAIGTSIAHDSHNVVVVGASDQDIYAVVKEIERNQGGLAAASGGVVVASLSLPIAGLLSQEPLEAVVAQIERLEKAARDMGCTAPSPFSILSFLALPVIPELKLTDMGLVDVMKMQLVKV
ncbi:MAG: adenine deaminase [Chloroflexi bacterium]|nr:adenine deaminase [Chloroflexota bacterium]